MFESLEKNRLPAALVVAGALAAPSVAEAAIVDLQNDGFVDMQSVGFQQGFVSGEMGAVTLGPVSDPFTILKITLLYGPGNNPPTTIVVHIYEDDGAGNVGPEISSANAQLMPADNAIQEIDLGSLGIEAPAGSIRVAIEFPNDGLPSIARDGDGDIHPGRNWIFTNGVWKDASDLGVTGDWVIRAEVDTMPSASTSSSAAAGSTSAGTGPGSGSSGSGSTGTGSFGTASGGGPCDPGAELACTGADACAGIATCGTDGMGFGPCECDEVSSSSGCGCTVPEQTTHHGALLAMIAAAGAAGASVVARARRRPKRPRRFER